MVKNNRRDNIDELLQRGNWVEARKLLKLESAEDPANHWVLTQIGVTLYEQAQYEDALKYFQDSHAIVSNCPLTLWNLAGTLDSLGKHKDAMTIYISLLEANQTPKDDPCWESKEWTDALKTDCVYRIGVCLQHMGKNKEARDYYRKYLTLVKNGFKGSYSKADVKCRMQALSGLSGSGGLMGSFSMADLELQVKESSLALKGVKAEAKFAKIVNATFVKAGINSTKGKRRSPASKIEK